MKAWQNYRGATMLSGYGKFGPYTHYLEGIPVEFVERQISSFPHVTNVHDLAWEIERQWDVLKAAQKQAHNESRRQEYLNSLIED